MKISAWKVFNKFFGRFGYYLVPYEPVACQLKAASKPMHMYKKGDEYFPCKIKHKLRYQSMLLATVGKSHPRIRKLIK